MDSPNDDHYQNLSRKTTSGAIALFVRQIVSKVIVFVGNIILARLLAPDIFGYFAVITFALQVFTYFADVGLGAALIQKKDRIESIELYSVFWLQQAVVALIVIIVYFATPVLTSFIANSPANIIAIVRLMALSFLLGSFKTIPLILMEKNIDFAKVAWVELVENIVYQVAAIGIAVKGGGLWSFVLAATARSCVGVILLYVLSGWRPKFCFSFNAVKRLIGFGLSYQGHNLLSMVKESVTPVFIGSYAGAAAVGYLNWAKSLAFAPQMITESYGRVAFPAFSQLQESKDLMQNAIEKSIRYLAIILLPLTMGMMALAPAIIHVIFTDKWLPAIWAFYFFCSSPLVISFTLPMHSALLSLGKANIMLKTVILLIVIEWGVGVPLVLRLGFTSIAFLQPIMITVFFLIFRRVLVQQGIRLRIIANIGWPTVAAFAAACSVKVLELVLGNSYAQLVVGSMLNFSVYIGLIYLFNRKIMSEMWCFINSCFRRFVVTNT